MASLHYLYSHALNAAGHRQLGEVACEPAGHGGVAAAAVEADVLVSVFGGGWRRHGRNAGIPAAARGAGLPAPAGGAHAVGQLRHEPLRPDRGAAEPRAGNDTHGHLVGDAVITAASLAIRQSLRQEDAAGRYGGDEFTVLCRGTTPAEAEGLAQRLHERIAAIRVRQVPDLVVGSSIGVAMASPDHADMQAWLHSADEALYRSKRQGRGRISFDGAVPGAA